MGDSVVVNIVFAYICINPGGLILYSLEKFFVYRNNIQRGLVLNIMYCDKTHGPIL